MAAKHNLSRELARRERTELAAKFREELLGELGRAPTSTELALVDALVSARLEIHVIAVRFVQGRATAEELARLSNARSQLSRLLRQLGLPKPPAEPEPLGAASWHPTKLSEDSDGA